MSAAPVAVVGAGPAGLAAADVLARHNLPVLLVDEQPQPGGQIFRQPPAAFTGAEATYTAGYAWGRALVRTPEHPAIDFAGSTTALGVLRDPDTASPADTDGPATSGTPAPRLRLALRGPDGVRSEPVSALLIATGAYDMPVPMPGWTLPGVLMAGAAQALAKSQRMVPPGPIVLCGAHPLLLVAAEQLLRAGAEITELVLARGLPGPGEAIRALPAVPGHAAMLAELGASLARLVRAGVRVSLGQAVTAAHGTDHVEAVEVTRLDSAGRPRGRSRTVPATTLVLGYGFQPSTELARQARATMRWDRRGGGWTVQHDGDQRTTAAGVYAAGEPTGVTGAEQARAEGALAGLAVLADLTGRADPAAWRDARHSLARARRFSAVVQRMFAPREPLLAALATAETVLCRCEEVTHGELAATLAANPQMSTVSAVKLECRAGMGPCQGRYCEAAVTRMLRTARGASAQEAGYTAAHLPIKPVALGELAALASSEPPPAEPPAAPGAGS
ncbi:NAD(P)/FAD-dependent oxidoreductase [Ruania suaedae]|uniref:FAD/NAD(P)-dependent oxidoreductase n=1 Tax=Ruania suaedae TaxID=2897774 RepID=UPI001E646B99|nr:NAD(P)/FAD-dependent oxidoreductase [Ruania suaedae]UFU03176.1 NAD(P)/FAD-dependent oxidoreductase [Ruania suaedae]